jgi:hypothetical protein
MHGGDAMTTLDTARYRYLLTDLVTRNVLSEGVALDVTSYSRRLCAQTDLSATMSLSDPTVRALTDPIGCTEPRRTALWVYRNEVCVWGGIIWTRVYRSDAEALDLTASTFESYFNRRRIRTTLTYSQVDQHSIMTDLVNQAQAVANGNVNIVVPTPAASGTKRDRVYYWYERAPFLQRMQELAGVQDGPDFTFDPFTDANDQPNVQLSVGTPLGINVDYMIDYPGSFRNYTWDEDGGQSANYWTAIGDPDPNVPDGPPLMADSSVSSEWLNGYPLLEDTDTHQGITSLATLTNYAQAAVAQSASNHLAPEATLHLEVGENLPGLGDILDVRIFDPYRFPGSLLLKVRITGWTVNISASEGETVTLELGQILQVITSVLPPQITLDPVAPPGNPYTWSAT